MSLFLPAVTELASGADLLRRRRYGRIETADGRLDRIVLRLCPKLVSLPGIHLGDWWTHRRRGPADRCLLYYDQPLRFPNFLTVKYVVTWQGTRYGTFLAAARALDEIARLKRTDALLCEVSNGRISRRMMARWGWQPHTSSRWHRHYIKRFYGIYPAGVGAQARPPASEALWASSPTSDGGVSGIV